MKRKPNKPEQEPRERPGSWEEPADPGGASSGAAGGGSPGGAGTEGTSGQSVHKSKFRQKSKQEQAAASKLRMEKRGEKLEAAKDKLAKQKPPKKPGPIRRVGRAAGGAAHGFVHGKIYENEHENVGIEGAHRSELVGEAALRHGSRFVKRKVREHPAKAVQRAESKYVKATADYHFRMAAQEHPEMSGNPVSRMWRKHRLKKQYQKRAREAVKTGAAGAAKKTAAATEKAGAKAVGFVKRHPVGVVLALACVLLLFMMQSCSSSLVTLGNAGAGAVGATTYPSQDEEMLAAEAAYCGMEAELQDYLDSYESTHDYDEYHFDLDSIEHDPYVLISILSVLHEGAWMLDQVQGTLENLFDRQYILTEDVVVEVRYRTESRTDSEGNSYTVEVPYNLVTRDLLYDEHTNKQFITVQTAGGNTFYIVIDYDKPVDEEGEQYETYFFSVVDEADLLAAAEAAGVEQAVCSCSEKCAAGAVNTECAVCSVNMEKCVGVEPEPVETEEPAPEEAEPETGGNMGMLLAVLAVALVGGGAAFYFKVLRPKQQKVAEPQEDYGDELPDYDGPDGYGDEDDGPPWDEEDEDGEEADK